MVTETAERWFEPSSCGQRRGTWRFRVLGPLAVERDGVELPVCPGKQRAFLVSLLLNVNRLVPVDMLMELLWDGEPPRSAVANIRTYASQLRTLVADRSVERVMWRPPGYSFAAGDDELDLLAYKRLVDDGHHCLAQGDTRTAVSRFGMALDMWRGAVAEDVDRTNRLGSRLTALDEQRVTLVEDWMDARLQHGDHRAALGQLRRLTGAHPLRERLWCQFMLASYRMGSSGPALQVFEEARRILADQLGVEPGPDLTRLRAGVLSHDPALLVDAPPVDLSHLSRGSRPAPCELPPGVSVLVGRDRELTTIRAAAMDHRDQPGSLESGMPTRRNGPVIVAIHGPGGTGKSALAVHAAYDLRQHYPDGQIYVDLHNADAGLSAEDPPDVLRRLLRTLDPGFEQVTVGSDEAGARFRSLTADRKMILVLDNAVDEAQVRPLLPSSTDTLVLVTSRRMLAALDGPVHLGLRPLSLDAARVLLGRSAGATRVEAEPEELGRLARLCDGLPLALRVVGARLASQPDRPLSALSALLSEHRCRLDVLSYGDLTVRASLAVSYQRLTTGARLFRLLGGVRVPDVGSAIAAVIVDQATIATEQALDELVDARLLERTRPGRYRMHDLVRLYAGELGAADGGIGPALHRAMSHYVKTARCAVASLRPGGYRHGTGDRVEAGEHVHFDGPTEALAWLEAERANMIEVSRQVHSAERDLANWVPLLTAALCPYLAFHQQWDQLGELGELSRSVATRLKDQHAGAMALRCLAVAGRQRGRSADATRGAHG
jgi:DNA-binding SARP family transcriptional activator